MTKGEHETAVRKALTLFDEWVECTGFVIPHTGYYYELQSIIEDAVDIGAKTALKISVNLDDYRE